MNRISEKLRSLSSGGRDTVLCVDYFDTIVSRRYSPEEIKRAWARRVIEHYGLELSWEDLYRQRRMTEDRLYGDSGSGEFVCETMLSMVYHEYLHDRFDPGAAVSVEDFISFSVSCEMCIERSSQYRNEDVLEAIKEYRPFCKKVILVSDFYFGQKYMSEWLRCHGAEGLFDEIFVSCDHLKSKKRGDLYEEIKRRNPGATLIMLGDNETADCQKAERSGFLAVHIDRKKEKKRYERFDRDAFGSTVRLLKKTYRALSPLSNYAFSLFLFTEKLYKRLMEERVEDVYFLARDGEFLKELFDLYQSGNPHGYTVNTHYLLVSRNATFLPCCKTIDEETFTPLFDEYKKISVYDFLLTLSFDESEIQKVLSSAELEKTAMVDGTRECPAFEALTTDGVFRELYEKKRTAERTGFLRYLADTIPDMKSAALVDVGWKGSIQDNIHKLLGENCSIKGYYLGLRSRYKSDDHSQKTGILFSEDPPSDYEWVFNFQAWFIEIILTGSHGKVKGYGHYPYDGEIEYTEDSDGVLFSRYMGEYREEIRKKFQALRDLFSCTRFAAEDFADQFLAFHYRLTRFFPILHPAHYYEMQQLHSEGFGRIKNEPGAYRKSEAVRYMLANFGWKYPPYAALQYVRDFIAAKKIRK